MSKRDAAIYREAARMVAEYEANYACHAICSANGKVYWYDAHNDPYVASFTELFRPNRIPRDADDHGWYGSVGTFDNDNTVARNARVLALCLAAAMAETGDI